MKILLLLLMVSEIAWCETPSTLYLAPGEILSLPAPPGQTLKVSNGKVIKLKDLGTKANLLGLKEGTSFFYVGKKSYKIYVLQASKLTLFEALQEGLKEKLGLKAEVIDKEIHITGQVYRWSDWEWLSTLSQSHGASYLLKAEVDKDVRAQAYKYIQAFLKQQALAAVQIQWSSPIGVTIPSSLKKQLKTYQEALAVFGLSVETREQQLALQPSVQVEVVMAELIERVDREFGLDWSPFGEFHVLPTSSLGSSLTATLKALERRGLGKILATPRILTRSGSEAEFHSGGEFPIPVTEYQSHYKSQNIIWKKHGIVLKFKPKADRQGRMSIKIYAELSVLTDQQAGGAPALLINKIESEFDLSQPRTVALSGLIRQDWHNGKGGLPWISQIPILGSLFSSQKFLNRKSELVIFVTPKIIDDVDAPIEYPQGWQRDSL